MDDSPESKYTLHITKNCSEHDSPQRARLRSTAFFFFFVLRGALYYCCLDAMVEINYRSGIKEWCCAYRSAVEYRPPFTGPDTDSDFESCGETKFGEGPEYGDTTTTTTCVLLILFINHFIKLLMTFQPSPPEFHQILAANFTKLVYGHSVTRSPYSPGF